MPASARVVAAGPARPRAPSGVPVLAPAEPSATAPPSAGQAWPPEPAGLPVPAPAVPPAAAPSPAAQAGPAQRAAEQSQQPEGESLRLRLDIGYDGSAFHGWARQPGLRTVQQVIEEALALALRLAEPPALTVAGRTDAGVHARGQVAHADVPAGQWHAAAASAVRRLARLLPGDVRVRSVLPAEAGFDARFGALWRRYSYRVCTDPAGPEPLRRHDTLWYPRALNLARLNEAALACLGEHDFAAFCRSRPGATTVRMLLRFEWQQAEPGVAVATVTADAFCHNMVRALVGALLPVGDGSRPPGWPAQLLAARLRDPGVRVVPAHGLCLEEVRYPAADQLAARAELTRRVRGSPPSG
jgi:tRNA pseudouridine38-40 synthase